MILSVSFTDVNQHDDINIIVDERSKTVVFETEKWIVPDEERIWVKIYSDGLAQYGYDVHHDRMHKNTFYTWSSNPTSVNEQLGLIGTKWELAKWSCAVAEGPDDCRFASGILVSLALKLAEANQNSLHYGLNEFYHQNFRSIEFVEPKEGIKLTNKVHALLNSSNWYDRYIETEDGKWMNVHDLSCFILHRDGNWSLNDWLGKTI